MSAVVSVPAGAAGPTGRWVYHDGEFRRAAEATVGPATQGLNYGTGVFEGIRAYWDGAAEVHRAVRLAEHYQRFLRSCAALRLAVGRSVDELCEITAELLRRNGDREDVYVRPIAYKLALEPGTSFGVKLRGVSHMLSVITVPMGAYVPAGGLRCGVSSWRRVPRSSVPVGTKVTGMYASHALAVDEAQVAGFDDAILLNQAGEVSEASTANVFLAADGELVTPSSNADILEGITRSAVMEIADREFGLRVAERPVSRSELYRADEIFLSGTGVEIAPVREVDGRPIGTTVPGPLTQSIRDVYLRAVRGRAPEYAHWLTMVHPTLEHTGYLLSD